MGKETIGGDLGWIRWKKRERETGEHLRYGLPKIGIFSIHILQTSSGLCGAVAIVCIEPQIGVGMGMTMACNGSLEWPLQIEHRCSAYLPPSLCLILPMLGRPHREL